MKRSLLLFVLFTCLSGISHAQITSSIYFLDRFSTYKDGSDGSPIWSPVKGSWQVVNKSYIQQAPDYDCASLYNVYLNGSFEIEATFKHQSGDVGEGFIFSSYQRTSTAYSQMLRFDGKSIFLLGYFSNGDFTATSSVKVESFDINAIHTLTVKVNRENDSYSVLLDGTTLKEHEPLEYRSGYCGLESGGGQVQFTKFRLSRGEPVENPFDVTWPKNFCMTPDHRFIIPDEIRGIINVLQPDSERSSTIGVPASSNGQLLQPNAVALVNEHTLAVTDRGANRLLLFDMNGTWKAATGWHGKEKGQFDGISAVATNSSGQIFVLEETNHRVQVFNDSLKLISVFGEDKLVKPLGIAIEGSSVYVVNSGNSQVEKYSWDGKSATWQGFFSYGGGEGRGIAVRNGNVYVSVLNQVHQYDTKGNLLNTFTGRAINFITPWGIVPDSSGAVYVSDFAGGRIVRLPPFLADEPPSVSFKNPSSAVIEWNTLYKMTGHVILTHGDEDTVGTFEESKPATVHKISVNNLSASTTYRYTVSSPNWTMPLRDKFSRFFTFRTPTENKMKQYARLPMVTLIFTNVTDEKLLHPGDTKVPPLEDGEVDRIENQIRDGIKFYWIHSRFNFFIDNEFVVVQEPYKRNQLYGSDWWYPPVDSMVETVLKQHGKDIKKYSGVIYLTCTQQYDTTLKKYVLAGKGGAFTNGVGTGKGYGISWWDVTRANHNAGNNWLFTHEYNHQVDDMFMVSGYPEYWFNHISATIGTAAHFGEHFDANRYIIRLVPQEEWFDLKYTTIETTLDSDNDGIPDNDPKLPLDETRLGSDPKKADTDGDIVPDVNETGFSNWVTEGWGETYGGTPIFPNLHSKDTDGDGLLDNVDPYPCIPVKPEINHAGAGNQPFATLNDERIHAKVSTSWDSSALHISFETDKMVPIKLMIDGNNDGWFLGRDNVLINCTPKNDSTVESKLQIFNATDPQQWPFMDTTLAKMYSIKASYRKENDKYLCDLQLPSNLWLGLEWRTGKKIGLLIGFLCPFDTDGNKRYVDIFEPNRFFDVTLK